MMDHSMFHSILDWLTLKWYTMPLGLLLSNLVIAAIGVTAVALSQSYYSHRRRWAPWFGLLGQPAWFYATYVTENWGMFLMCFAYTWAWGKGLYTQWWLPYRQQRSKNRRSKQWLHIDRSGSEPIITPVPDPLHRRD